MNQTKGYPDRETVEQIRRIYPVGSIIVLDEMTDEYALPVGTLGKVTGVDDIGSVMPIWQDGSSLHVLYGIDRCHLANEEEIRRYNELIAGQTVKYRS